LLNRPSLVTTALASIAAEVRVFPHEEGIQPDMSFHQHGKLLYNGGYGKGFAADLARLIYITSGTRFAMPKRVVDLFADFMLDGSRWMVRGRTFDAGTIGREIARVGHCAAQYRSGLSLLVGVAHLRQAEVRATLEVDAGQGKSLVAGNRMFWSSDFMAHHRDEFYFSVRMPSNRILKADGAHCGGEGRVCHHMADGVTHIMRDGDEYRDLYPVWNWRQIPGATIAQSTAEFDANTLVRRGETAFSGGASDGTHGCAAVDFSRDDLRARKAWFFFQHGMVALGAGISATSSDAIRTTINQCHWRGAAHLDGRPAALPAGEYPLTPGAAFTHDGFAYRVISGDGVLRLGAQSGAWSDVGVGSAERQTLPVLNATIDHGVKPDHAAYAYTVFSGAAAAGAAAHAASIIVISNTPRLQAVWHAGERRGHAVFYEPGEVSFPDGQRIASDRRCVLLYHPKPTGEVALTVAQPEQLAGVVTLTCAGRSTTTLGVTLPLREYAGSSQTLTWRP
jgi:chondroitin AC lyase